MNRERLDEDACFRAGAADPDDRRGVALPEANLYLRYEDTIVVTDTGLENFTDFLPMELGGMGRLVLEKGVVHKVPPTPEGAIPKRRR